MEGQTVRDVTLFGGRSRAEVAEVVQKYTAAIPKNLPDLAYDPFTESREFIFGSPEEALEAIAACVTEERGSQWKISAVVASAVA